MKEKQTVTLLVILISILSSFAAIAALLSGGGPGTYDFTSIHGQVIPIYGKGLYQYMSADVAIQGLAQDVVTLFPGIPLLLFALVRYRQGAVRYRFLLAGITGYFFVTYLFYTAMAMYNILYLVYVALMGLSFFALFNLLCTIRPDEVKGYFNAKAPVKLTGGFLVFNAIVIALMWLGSVIPPLLDGTIYPDSLHHYTTLIVQAFDLGLLLPISLVAGILLMQKKPMGYITAVPYIIFLSILMTALTAKIIAMGINGVNIIPAVFIIPVFNLTTIVLAVLTLRNIPATGPWNKQHG